MKDKNMEVSKVGSVPYFGRTSAGTQVEKGVITSENKEIKEKSIATAALAITSIGLATIALIKKGRKTNSLALIKDAAGNTLGVSKASLTLDKLKFKELSKDIKTKVSDLLGKAVDTNSYVKILEDFNIGKAA